MVSIDSGLLEPMLLRQRHLVICVDDDPSILAALRRCLRMEPYELVTVGTADEALELIGRREVSLLVTDHRMPGMCGADLFEEVKRRSPKTHRVMLTGYPGSARVSYGLAHEIEWMISKPWNDEALRLTLRQLLHEQEMASPAPQPSAPMAPAPTPEEGAKHARRPGRLARARRFPSSLPDHPSEGEGPPASASPPRDAAAGAPTAEGKGSARTVEEAVPDPEEDKGSLLGGNERARRKERLASLGQLAAGFVHEIQNPVGSLLSNLSTLQDYGRGLARLLKAALDLADRVGTRQETSGSLEEFSRIRAEVDPEFILGDFEEAILQSRKGAERIGDLAAGIGQFARLDRGVPQPVDLVLCLEDALRICWNEVKFKASLRREYSEVPLLRGSPVCLEQVFVIVLVNLARAIEKKGELYLSVGREGDFAVVKLRDLGRGISPERVEHLFDSPPTSSSGAESLGFELPLAQEIVQAHDGSMGVQSGDDEGTGFLIRLPLFCPGGGVS